MKIKEEIMEQVIMEKEKTQDMLIEAVKAQLEV